MSSQRKAMRGSSSSSISRGDGRERTPPRASHPEVVIEVAPNSPTARALGLQQWHEGASSFGELGGQMMPGSALMAHKRAAAAAQEEERKRRRQAAPTTSSPARAGTSLAEKFRLDALAKARAAAELDDDPLEQPPMYSDDDDLPDFTLGNIKASSSKRAAHASSSAAGSSPPQSPMQGGAGAMLAQRPTRRTGAKQGSYVFEPQMVRPSDRTLATQAAKATLAVRAGLRKPSEVMRANAVPLDEDERMRKKLLQERKKQRKAGLNAEGFEDTDALIRRSLREMARMERGGGASSEASSRASSPDADGRRRSVHFDEDDEDGLDDDELERVMQGVGDDDDSEMDEGARAALEILRKDRRQGKRGKADTGWSFWSGAGKTHATKPPELKSVNAVDLQLEKLIEGGDEDRLAAFLRSGTLRMRARYDPKPALACDSSMGSAFDEENAAADAELHLATWLFSLVIHGSAVLGTAANVALRDVLQGGTTSQAHARRPQLLAALLTSLPPHLSRLGARTDLLAGAFACDVEEMQSLIEKETDRQAERPTLSTVKRHAALERLIDVLQVIASLPRSTLRDAEVTTARRDVSLLLLLLQADPSHAYLSVRLPSILASFNEDRPSRTDDARQCTRIVKLLRDADEEAQFCARLLKNLPSADARGRLIRAWCAWACLMQEGNESFDSPVLPLGQLIQRLREPARNPLLVHAARRLGSDATDEEAQIDEADYEELNARIGLLDMALADLGLQLCQFTKSDQLVNGAAAAAKPEANGAAGDVSMSEVGDETITEAPRSAATTPAPAAAPTPRNRTSAVAKPRKRAADLVPQPAFGESLAPFTAYLSRTAARRYALSISHAKVECVRLLLDALREANGKINDGRGAFLARSKAKDALQRLELGLRYRLTALVGDVKKIEQPTLQTFFKQKEGETTPA